MGYEKKIHEIGFYGDTVCQIMPTQTDKADSNVVKTLEPVLCSSRDDVPLK
jgi:hypothetical protein